MNAPGPSARSCAGAEEPRRQVAVFLLQPDCLAPEITKAFADRLPWLGCDKEPSAHRAELAEDRVSVLKASTTRVVACFGADQVLGLSRNAALKPSRSPLTHRDARPQRRRPGPLPAFGPTLKPEGSASTRYRVAGCLRAGT